MLDLMMMIASVALAIYLLTDIRRSRRGGEPVEPVAHEVDEVDE